LDPVAGDRVGEIEQPHVQPWSTVLRVPTPDGPVWFKAVTEEGGYEPPLTEQLGGIRADLVPRLIATDLERRWMLMRDAGRRLRDVGEGLDAWETILPAYAELQLAAVSSVERFFDSEVPDERLGGLTGRLTELLASEEFLMLDRPDGLTLAERDRLISLLPDIASRCREVAAFGIPETIQHDDLHDGNVYVDDDGYRVLDWGDACISHPFHTMTVLLRATAWRLDLEPGGAEILRMRDAYLESFASFGSRKELIDVAALAYRTGTIARALAWHRYLAARPPEERLEDLDTIPYGLQRYLEDGPIGTWRW
jgi:hypothetical protein